MRVIAARSKFFIKVKKGNARPQKSVLPQFDSYWIGVPDVGYFHLSRCSTEMAKRSSLIKPPAEHCLVFLVRDCVFLQ